MMMVKREARQGQRLARHSPLTGNSAICDCGCKVQNENWLKVSTFFLVRCFDPESRIFQQQFKIAEPQPQSRVRVRVQVRVWVNKQKFRDNLVIAPSIHDSRETDEEIGCSVQLRRKFQERFVVV